MWEITILLKINEEKILLFSRIFYKMHLFNDLNINFNGN